MIGKILRDKRIFFGHQRNRSEQVSTVGDVTCMLTSAVGNLSACKILIFMNQFLIKRLNPMQMPLFRLLMWNGYRF